MSLSPSKTESINVKRKNKAKIKHRSKEKLLLKKNIHEIEKFNRFISVPVQLKKIKKEAEKNFIAKHKDFLSKERLIKESSRLLKYYVKQSEENPIYKQYVLTQEKIKKANITNIPSISTSFTIQDELTKKSDMFSFKTEILINQLKKLKVSHNKNDESSEFKGFEKDYSSDDSIDEDVFFFNTNNLEKKIQNIKESSVKKKKVKISKEITKDFVGLSKFLYFMDNKKGKV